jgi:hypothetical protein
MTLPQEASQQTQAVITRALKLTRETRELLHRAKEWSREFQQTVARVIPPGKRPVPPDTFPWHPEGIVVIETQPAKARAYLLVTKMRPIS